MNNKNPMPKCDAALGLLRGGKDSVWIAEYFKIPEWQVVRLIDRARRIQWSRKLA